jgi:hypothetical protein
VLTKALSGLPLGDIRNDQFMVSQIFSCNRPWCSNTWEQQKEHNDSFDPWVNCGCWLQTGG